MTRPIPFADALSAHAARVVDFLDARITTRTAAGEIERPERLIEAMRHGVFNGGKRLRPFLVFEANALCDGEAEAALPFAAAVECVHCYSLIHDDLPAMDDDDLRRGQPTVHRAFDEATAILAGDALLTLAFDLAVDRAGGLPPDRLAELVRILARGAGVGGMAGGQMLDLAHEHVPAGADRIETIHAMKTGALIVCACEAGAVIAGGDQRQDMRQVGALLGRAFQLADDLLDVTADAATMGKATGKDAEAGKQTLIAMHGVDWARGELDALVGRIDDLLAPFGDRAARLREAARFVAHRRH